MKSLLIALFILPSTTTPSTVAITGSNSRNQEICVLTGMVLSHIRRHVAPRSAISFPLSPECPRTWARVTFPPAFSFSFTAFTIPLHRALSSSGSFPRLPSSSTPYTLSHYPC
eukprot:Lithocolla_globosa_v1_NODE_785_length_3283_cov_3.234201.p3 type:complete len:113 gc:universal NODE_785_length_3283_cov_3.234201:2766-2428(-)